ncbi:MAG TPA: E2/UBC family protein [Gemmataceae bacterium]|nr:E2/UBC family protein [Gemmataceae bacterium]
MCAELIKDEVAALGKRGISLELIVATNQWYVLASGLVAPVPPWNQKSYDILVAIPLAYDAAGLDSFYLALPHAFNGGEHPRVKGDIVNVMNRQWRLASWHYPDGKPWRRGLDDLATHLAHCQGFFLNRGAVNAM